ncbi:NAD(P)H-dependent oxidoreductase subunit E [Anaerosalibacter bizertensis]|uniref:NAD(P)H-dependent oxidoreductase subunit E n=1 Tax=Anaerosalibacter bizertensis TaxID=932217 RepID=A0A844FFH7_9FIRM|nr:NAD(P)H-dependent oxidoreductase subunit E [Anaerosalibacter bizertensis]MBV1817769.1 NAD(P)H-dependent oxidoreductase subunit E [Bacteroidales bacterium MSK.15.36]HHV27038.1 NAD(P)H-dependent oxidoreductase subunit E [Tissierellia bacterium]MBU5293628.1 NAD(P)H-dependent oxidoreductase subunit E [Anaerosalibacter bizertensis]MCB5559030.1 NAD(P)H-dependent oxidoreductase subunit E [Anaerosalibacter bizertensis]MCG4564310.1 NAD(P)H-dependent oxidoreductase subunit E [Anaerosalibacter bizerte
MEFVFDWEANEEKVRQFKIYIEENRKKKGALMAVLHEAQDLFGHIPIEIQNMISEELKIPLSEIYGVVTFYSQFSLIPKGKYEIGICLGTACYVKGSKDVLNKVEEILEIGVGETTADGKFSISATRCLGACGLAPVLVVNDDVYGKTTPNDVEGILNKYK